MNRADQVKIVGANCFCFQVAAGQVEFSGLFLTLSYLTFIDINFKEHCSWILGCQLFIEWSDSSTWSTPGKHNNKNLSRDM